MLDTRKESWGYIGKANEKMNGKIYKMYVQDYYTRMNAVDNVAN